MRALIHKRSSTKAERRFAEILKKNHIAFRFRELIAGREVDFIIGKIAIEIGDHSQNVLKNKGIIEAGYSLMFITNKELRESSHAVEENLLNNWL